MGLADTVYPHRTMEPMRLSRAPPLRNLRAFCIAARHKSFKAAADELALTPSAVSHQMKELEEVMGVRLFERKTRALALTTAGHTLLDEIAPLLDMMDRSLAQFSRRNRRRNVRVLLPPFFGLKASSRCTRALTSKSIRSTRGPPITRQAPMSRLCSRTPSPKESKPCACSP